MGYFCKEPIKPQLCLQHQIIKDSLLRLCDASFFNLSLCHIKEVVKDIWTMFLAGTDHCWDSVTVNDEVAEAAIGGGDKLMEKIRYN